MDKTPNFLLLTLDSCRWDSYTMAHTPVLDKYLTFKKAYSQSTYTLPSHISMYQGLFPSSKENIPFFNRFSKPLLRIDQRNKKVSALINFPKGTTDIFKGFESFGKQTFGLGAMSWFKHEWLTSPFNKFVFTGIHLNKQLDLAKDFFLKNQESGFALMINIGETHEPYEYGGLIKPQLDSRSKIRSFQQGDYDKKLHYKQVQTLEKIDKQLAIFFEFLLKLETSTLVVCCGDHGECFGEDNLWGHGFYHPKVMEVPLGIGGINYTLPIE